MNKILLTSIVILVSIALFVTHIHVSGIDDREGEIEFPREERSMEDPTDDDYTDTCDHPANTIHANFTDGQVVTTGDDCD